MRKAQFTFLFLSLSLVQAQAQESFSLTDAISFALTHHPSIKVADLENKDALWSYREAKAIGMPRITGNINYSYYYQRPVNPVEDFISPAVYGVLFQESVIPRRDLGDPRTFEFSFLRKNQLDFGLMGEVLVFDGNFLKGLKAARMYIDLAEKQVQLTEQQIIQNVTRAYQNVLIAERNDLILLDNIDNIIEMLRQAKLVYENGFAEELDVDRLDLSLQNLNYEREKLQQLIQISYNVLKYQMAYPIQDEMRVNEKLETVVERMLLNPEDFTNDLDPNQRPEHRLLIDAIELDKADLVRIKQGYIPSVSASVGYNQSLQRDNLFDGSEAGFLDNGFIGLKTRIPIYDGGNTKSKIERKKITIEKKQTELEEFDRAMALQVYNALSNLENAKSNLENAKRSLALNEKIYDKTKIKYNEGVGSSIELSQAEASLYQSQGQYIGALYELLSSKTELEISTGEILKKYSK